MYNMHNMHTWIKQPQPWLWMPHRILWPVTRLTVCWWEPPAWQHQHALAHRASHLLQPGVRVILLWHGLLVLSFGPQWHPLHYIPQLTHYALTQYHMGALINVLGMDSSTPWAHSPHICNRRTTLHQLLPSPLVRLCLFWDLLYLHPPYNRAHLPTLSYL